MNGFQKLLLVLRLNVRMIFINSMSLFRFICSGTQINTFCLRYWVSFYASCLSGSKPCLLNWDYSIYRKWVMMTGFSGREYCALVFLCLVTFCATGRIHIYIIPIPMSPFSSLLQIAQLIVQISLWSKIKHSPPIIILPSEWPEFLAMLMKVALFLHGSK